MVNGGDTLKLDVNQRKAVNFREGLAVLAAGAGAGKTRTIIARIDALVSEGVSAERIMAVTFTTAAAQEMKERLSPEAQEVHASTIHSMALAITRDYLGSKFNGKRFGGSVLSEKESRALLSYIMQEPSRFNTLGADLIRGYELEPKRLKNYAATISRLKDDLVTPAMYASRSDADPGIAELYRLYEEAKSKGYRHPQTKLDGQVTIDFGDMILLAVKALRERADILSDWQGRYDYTMVDESQDCNMAQYVLIRLVTAKHGNVMYVGDDWQSIYRFRGACPMEFIKTAKDATVIPLEINYRSRSAIVECANRLISHNEDQIKKNVKAVRA